eukprot:4197034-Prymnesium_polylepis.1
MSQSDSRSRELDCWSNAIKSLAPFTEITCRSFSFEASMLWRTRFNVGPLTVCSDSMVRRCKCVFGGT